MPKQNKKQIITIYSFLIFLSLSFIGPMIFTIFSSLKNNSEIFSAPFSFPTIARIENYIDAWNGAKMGKYFFNSLGISISTVILLAFTASMVSFVLSRFNFRFNKYLSIFFLLGMMIPMQSILVPISYFISVLGLKNNLVALVLIYVAFSLPFSILVLTGFMRGINNSLIEAAIIDGASFWKVYSKIVFPLTMPAIATISIFNFLGAWNNIIFPLLFINDDKLKPITLGLLNFNGERGSEYGLLMAAIAITVLIPLVIYMLFQEKIESGLSAGAIKE
ncbi:raffinose/stachyose/melibiose transport system permease protein [Cetobacterium ceti]|uniref:Raffinose/stachyose/melibiose transport system permease protein n=1 Tax=Cetobacterium ceti TaxID=180163 RepID=A0A1T4K5Q0_9FUSO|nr:carbohydrate ABC transporter permease [Cetobacterium ceti]SJZ37663.1 raffinose/stachyose/melibiose transport system permease protein [Cetobacterium ceti]